MANKTALWIPMMVVCSALQSQLQAQEKPLTSGQCQQLGGVVMGQECPTGKSLGPVTGLKCECNCCSGAEVQDCATHKIDIVTLCNKGDVLYYEFSSQGMLEVESIHLWLPDPGSSNTKGIEVTDLKGTYQLNGGEIELPRSGKIKISRTQPDLTRYKRIKNYLVRYRGAPKPCLFNVERVIDLCDKSR